MRLIDADALVEKMEADAEYISNMVLEIITYAAINDIKNQPTIEERKTGHWIKISPAGIYECSECGKNVMTADIDAYDFCHGCGAKMEAEHGS